MSRTAFPSPSPALSLSLFSVFHSFTRSHFPPPSKCNLTHEKDAGKMASLGRPLAFIRRTHPFTKGKQSSEFICCSPPSQMTDLCLKPNPRYLITDATWHSSKTLSNCEIFEKPHKYESSNHSFPSRINPVADRIPQNPLYYAQHYRNGADRLRGLTISHLFLATKTFKLGSSIEGDCKLHV